MSELLRETPALVESEGTNAVTLDQWAIVCNHAMDINGFNDTTGRYLNGTDPVAQIAALSVIKIRLTDLVEAVRKPYRGKPGGMKFGKALWLLLWEVIALWWMGLEHYTERYLRHIREWGKPVHCSKAQVVHRLVLADTETSEAVEAVHKDDASNLAEEIIDTIYRLLNLVGHWNQTHRARIIPLDATLRWKHGNNLERGYRHGGKRA